MPAISQQWKFSGRKRARVPIGRPVPSWNKPFPEPAIPTGFLRYMRRDGKWLQRPMGPQPVVNPDGKIMMPPPRGQPMPIGVRPMRPRMYGAGPIHPSWLALASPRRVGFPPNFAQGIPPIRPGMPTPQSGDGRPATGSTMTRPPGAQPFYSGPHPFPTGVRPFLPGFQPYPLGVGPVPTRFRPFPSGSQQYLPGVRPQFPPGFRQFPPNVRPLQSDFGPFQTGPLPPGVRPFPPNVRPYDPGFQPIPPWIRSPPMAGPPRMRPPPPGFVGPLPPGWAPMPPGARAPPPPRHQQFGPSHMDENHPARSGRESPPTFTLDIEKASDHHLHGGRKKSKEREQDETMLTV